MLRAPTDPAARLALLRAARAKSKPGDECNFEEMARIVGVTVPGFKKMLKGDPDVPMLARGSEGIPYRFAVRATLDYLIARLEATLKDRKTRAAKLLRLSGASAPAGAAAIEQADDGLSIADLRLVGQITMDQHKLKMQQGRYLVADDVRAFLDEYHGHFQSETLSVLSKIDPAGQLDAALRQAVEGAMRNLLVNLQGRMERHIESLNGKRAA